MTSFREFYQSNDKFRLSIDYDQCGWDMEPEIFSPFVSIERGNVTDKTGKWVDAVDQNVTDALIEAINRWGSPNSALELRMSYTGQYAPCGWELVERYMRAYWDVPELFTFYSDGIRGWYVGTCEGVVKEYEDWCNGEVYSITVEKKVSGSKRYDDGRVEEFDEWEDVDDIDGIHGFIGYDYAVQEADRIWGEVNG